MPELAEVVRALAAREGVRAVLLATADGLPIDHAGTVTDTEAIAALAATVARQAAEMAAAAGGAALRTLVAETDDGILLVVPSPADSWLLVQVAADTDFGPLLFELRRHAPALTSLL